MKAFLNFFPRVLQRLAPQRNFSVRLGLVTGVIVLSFAVIFSIMIGKYLRQTSETLIGKDFTELAFQMTDKLDRGMFERYREIQILATLDIMDDQNIAIDVKRDLLEQLKFTYSDYAWIGLTDPQGKVIASTGGLLEGADVSERPWFVNGQLSTYVGDVHEAVLLASLLPNSTNEPLRFVDIAAPILNDDGQLVGVLGAHLSWHWANEVQESVLRPLQERSDVEMLIVSESGVILLSPRGLQLQDASRLISFQTAQTTLNGYIVESWPDSHSYLVGYSHSMGFRDYPGLGWIVLVRQKTEKAFVTANAVQKNILSGGVAIGFILTAVVWWFSRGIVKPIVQLSKAAERISKGDTNAPIPLIPGNDEIASLSLTLNSLVKDLANHNKALAKTAARFRILHIIDHTILSAEAPEIAARLGLEFIGSLLPLRLANLTVFDWETQEGIVFAHFGLRDKQLPIGRRIILSEYPSEDLLAMRSGETRVIPNLTPASDLSPTIAALYTHGLRSCAAVPLIVMGELIGSVNLGADYPNAFTPEFLEVVREVADQLAIAIQQARYRERIEQHTAELEQRVIQRTAELQQMKDRAEAILNNSYDPIILATFDAVIQQVNPAFENMFGFSEKECFGESLLSLTTSKHTEELLDGLKSVITTGHSHRLEVLLSRRDGTTVSADIALAVVRQQEKIQGLVCSVSDITKHKQAENEIRTVLEKERELKELKLRFTSMVSHEFRTPLSVILSSTNLLEDYGSRMSDDQKQIYLKRIQAQVKQIDSLLTEVLSLSRAEAIQLETNIVDVNLTNLCSEVIEQFQHTTSSHLIELNIEGEQRLIALDLKLMRQAIGNLLSNAIKYSPNSGQVKVDLIYQTEQIRICIEDQGIGIPEKDLKRLFEDFHRAENVADIPGTGLGLPIVKRAVEAHGGSIHVKSMIGIGTTFTIELPVDSQG